MIICKQVDTSLSRQVFIVCMRIVGLTTEFTLIIRLGEPLTRDGKSNIESNAGAR